MYTNQNGPLCVTAPTSGGPRPLSVMGEPLGAVQTTVLLLVAMTDSAAAASGLKRRTNKSAQFSFDLVSDEVHARSEGTAAIVEERSFEVGWTNARCLGETRFPERDDVEGKVTYAVENKANGRGDAQTEDCAHGAVVGLGFGGGV